MINIPSEVIYSATAAVIVVNIAFFVVGYFLGYGASDSSWSKKARLERERRRIGQKTFHV